MSDRRLGGKSLDPSDLKDLLRDRRVWVGLGVVVKRSEDSSHFEIADGDVLVEVDLMPERTPIFARLAHWHGVWKIPAVGAEVMIAVAGGELEGDPMLIAELSAAVPSALDEQTLVILGPQKVIVASTDAASKVYLGTPDATGTEPATLATTLTNHLTAVKTYIDGHTHNYVDTNGVASTTAATTPPLSESPSVPNIKASNTEVK